MHVMDYTKHAIENKVKIEIGEKTANIYMMRFYAWLTSLILSTCSRLAM